VEVIVIEERIKKEKEKRRKTIEIIEKNSRNDTKLVDMIEKQ
jgi:hypothetical protein